MQLVHGRIILSAHAFSKGVWITTGTLFLVATPIGNLGDISARAVQILSEADFIAAEDTRITLNLLRHLNIKKQLVSYYEHNRRESGEKIVSRIMSGENCALVTDAGTPGISDPGEDLVRLCVESEIPAIAVPGPCAAVTALSISGFPAGRFTFEGFLSTTKKNRYERLYELKSENRTMVFYEAPHKLARTLNDMLAVFGDRRISLSRELTKLYEETMRCTLSEAVDHFGHTPPRGEFVLVVEGTMDDKNKSQDLHQAAIAAESCINSGSSAKDAIKKVSEETGVSKNELYKKIINRDKG